MDEYDVEYTARRIAEDLVDNLRYEVKNAIEELRGRIRELEDRILAMENGEQP